MKPIESLQSSTGQLALDVPGVPFVDFDSSLTAFAGVTALVGGVYLGVKHIQATRNDLNNTTFPAGSDEAKIVRSNVLNGGIRKFAMGAAAVGALSAGLLNQAGPFTEEKTNDVGNVVVIVNAAYDAYATDVLSDDEEQITRIEATVNTFNRLSVLNGIEVSFIASGATPEFVGKVTNANVDEANTVVDNFTNYVGNIGNRGSASNGGGDIETALSIAEGLDPDKIIIFAGTLDGNNQSRVLDNEEIEGNRRVSVIAVGKSGSVVKSLGQDVPAPIEPAINQTIVGIEDSYTAESTTELAEAVNAIINDQIQTTERNDVKIFEKLRNTFAVPLILATYAVFGLEGRRKSNVTTKKN